MGDIVEFAPRINQELQHDVRPDGYTEDGYFLLNYMMSKDELMWRIDEVWNEIYIGNKITVVNADDDGNIYFKFDNVKHGANFVDYIKHMAFLIGYLNKNYRLIDDFMKDYEEFLKSSDVERVLSIETKEKHS